MPHLLRRRRKTMKPSNETRFAPLLRLLVAGFLVTTLFMLGAPTVLAGGGGNSANAKLCQKGGWTALYTRQGQSFASEQQCVGYAAQGGQLINQRALACLNDGWKTLGQASTTPFVSEQSCVDFVMGGGAAVAAGGADLSLSYDPVSSWITITNAGPVPAMVTVRIEAVMGFVPVLERESCGGADRVYWSDWYDAGGTVNCQVDFATWRPIPSGGSLLVTQVCEAWPVGGYAAVWESSQPDPDSIPGNLVTTEDDYVAIPFVPPNYC
jgi:hypothetical protein